ncbi:MAG: HPr family phosphocarrier protein [Deltaproteobacteria bacterium]|nr:HPr family phosphocarrier protein [Deltaproteobacteria bacterium]
MTVRGRFEIVNELGLHARAAARLVQVASAHSAQVRIAKDGREVDAKSIMGLLLLCGQRGSSLEVTIDGPDEAEALDAIGELIRGRFGEER